MGLVILSLFLILGFQNCSDVEFKDLPSEAPSASAVESVNPQPQATQGAGDALPGQVPVIQTGAALQVYTQVKQCQPFSNCVVDYYLKEAMDKKLEFTWRTNDTKYQENPQRYAQPGKHYVSGSGVVTFNAGETHKQIIIQSLSGFTVGMEIPFLWDNCVYGGEAVDCRSILMK